MREIAGVIILPPNTPCITAEHVLVEVRDVSLEDVLSTVVAEQRIENVDLAPSRRIRFCLLVPEVDPNLTLSLRVHIDINGNDRVTPGDLLTTVHYPVVSGGETPPLEVLVSVI
jgi:uncharacterized lipoprotein YbaY